MKKTPTYTGYRGLAEIYAQTKNYEGLLSMLGEVQDKAGMLESLGLEATKIAQDADLMQQLHRNGRKDALRLRRKRSPAAKTLAMGMLATDAKQWAAADEFFTRAVKADPQQSNEVYLIWGLGLLLAERSGEAAKVFQQALDHQQTVGGRGEFLLLSGRCAGLGKSHRRGARGGEQGGRTQARLDRLPRPAGLGADVSANATKKPSRLIGELLRKHENDFSSEEFREGLKDVRLAFSNVCVLLGRMAEAEEQLELVLDEYPEDTGALNDLGYLWADRNEHLGRACRMIRKAVEAEPENAAYRDSLGWVLFRQQKYAEAAAELQKASEKIPTARCSIISATLIKNSAKPKKPTKAGAARRNRSARKKKKRKRRRWRRK